MRIVVALGGNALLKRGEPLDADRQRANARAAAIALAPLLEAHEVILTHGNGPQVGLLALQATAYQGVAPYPLDVLGAETEGMIGYVLQQELANVTHSDRLVTLLTQTLVDRNDPAFETPTKFVGPVYSRTEAESAAARHRWRIAPDGSGWRRVVPSPQPQSILGTAAIEALMQQRFIVICAGGGGVPVCRESDGTLCGVEAVVDKDLASALLAEALDADCLMMLTDVDAAYIDWGTPQARAIRASNPQDIVALPFAAGSMAPKVEAACRIARTGRRAYIGKLDDAMSILSGATGTMIDAWTPKAVLAGTTQSSSTTWTQSSRNSCVWNPL